MIVPVVAFPLSTPFTCQVTAGFEALSTVALNCCGPPDATNAEVGETKIVTAPVLLFLLPLLVPHRRSNQQAALLSIFEQVASAAWRSYEPASLKRFPDRFSFGAQDSNSHSIFRRQ